MRVVLADHDPKALWALKTLLDEEPDIEVAGEAEDARQLQGIMELTDAQLFLLDRRLPGQPIEILIAALHALAPRPVVVVMSKNYEDSRLMLRAGADAFVSKGDPPDWLLGTLRRYAEKMTGKSH